MFELCQVVMWENRKRSMAGEAGFSGSITVLLDAGTGRAATTVNRYSSWRPGNFSDIGEAVQGG